MKVDLILDALALPPESRISQRVPKKLLAEQGGKTAADRRQIQDSIEELMWLAALKPIHIGVPAFRDQIREYLEIAVLIVQFRDSANDTRLTELIHRAIPYPLLLIAENSGRLTISLAHKRWSQAESTKTVIESVESVLLMNEFSAETEWFRQAVPLSRQPSRNLFTLYQGWIETVEALNAARITGRYSKSSSEEVAAARRMALAEYTRIEREITSLRAQAEREKQVHRLADINLEIHRLRKLQEEHVQKL